MSDFTWIAPTIVAFTGLVAAVVAAWRSKSNAKTLAVVAADTAKVVEHTNGTLHAANAAVRAAEGAKDVLLERVGGLEKALAALQASGLMAATKAEQAATDVREAQAVMPPAHEPKGEG